MFARPGELIDTGMGKAGEGRMRQQAAGMGKELQEVLQTLSNTLGRFNQQLVEIGRMVDQQSELNLNALRTRTRGRAELNYSTGNNSFANDSRTDGGA
jgi:hypothetical protein